MLPFMLPRDLQTQAPLCARIVTLRRFPTPHFQNTDGFLLNDFAYGSFPKTETSSAIFDCLRQCRDP